MPSSFHINSLKLSLHDALPILIGSIKDSYISWINKNTSFTKTKPGIIELSSPFLDAIDENIKIYIEPDVDEFRISDDGFTLWSLRSEEHTSELQSRGHIVCRLLFISTL